jgi:hypothetical protein
VMDDNLKVKRHGEIGCTTSAGFDLCPNGEPFALVFGGDAGVNGGVPARLVPLACKHLYLGHVPRLPVLLV